ncbi:acyl-CoA synthetase [Pelagibacterales bacterium SAG-MED17]|nr:acyl-CoA synthetase [Pelagibacterales bacterium SAG-MED17]
MSPYETNLDKNNANYVPLTPLSFLERAKDIYPNYEAVVYESRKYTWSDVYKRCIKFASALDKLGIKTGDTVSVLAFNTPEIFEAHYSIPMVGAVINAINTRLDSKTISYILNHSEAKVLIVDRQFHDVVKKALEEVNSKITIIDIDDKDANIPDSKNIGSLEYEEFLNSGDENFKWKMPKDEWQAIALGYTSGTTGNPKGVVYHHRGSYLMATGSAVAWNMPNQLNFLYTVPMFHCNGWCYPWTMSMIHGRVICLRNIDVKKIFELIDKYEVTHFGGAPIVLNMLANAPQDQQKELKRKVYVLTAGAPPPSIIFEKMQKLGFEVMHVYGLTETYGHILQCAWNEDWDELDQDNQNEIRARQGVRYPNTEGVIVMDPETMEPVPYDGKTMGEIMIRGNVVMKGYFKDKEATEKSMEGGWFHSGDLAVTHPSGYIKIQDRSKDIIISGGENISSIEIENTISKHPAVSLAAVVAKPDEKWGETPCAFVELIEGKSSSEEEIITFCRETLAGFKLPKKVVFAPLPKTSTGKIQKFELRKQAKELN